MARKPYDDFPLFSHRNGQWCKKINGKHHYFGTDWRAALRKYHLLVGGPRDTLESTVERYIGTRRLLQQSGEITGRHLKDIEWTLGHFVRSVGPRKVMSCLRSPDYGRWRAEIGKTNGPVSIGNHIRKVRAFLSWCLREGIIERFPTTDALTKPTRGQLRRERARRGPKMFTPDEIRSMLDLSDPQFRAMVLLGINAGLGPSDLAGLRTHHIQGGWLDYPRPKTGIERRVPLWQVTQEALAAIWPDDGRFFKTRVELRFRARSRLVGVHRDGRGIYALRHTLATIGEEAHDGAAVSVILGHGSNDIASVYRERMSDARLRRVVDHVHDWVFQPELMEV